MIAVNQLFWQKRGINKIKLCIKRDPMRFENVQNRGSILGKFPTIFKYGSIGDSMMNDMKNGD